MCAGSIQLNTAEWRINASVYYAIIGTHTVVSPIRHQAIIWSNAENT